MTEESVIDRAAFDELIASTGSDQEFLGNLIDTFLADSIELLVQMQGSLAANDTEGFRRAAHSLKSSSASFGANGLATQARELEMMARAGTLDGAGVKVAYAEETYQRVSAELGRLRGAA